MGLAYAEDPPASAPPPLPSPPSPVTWTLIAANLALFGGEALWGGVDDGDTIYRMGGILGGGHPLAEPWRFLASTLLHFGPLHLLVNMWSLYALGRSLETFLGPARLFTVYWVAGLAGGVVAALAMAPGHLAAGASGAIWGLMVAEIVLVLRLRRRLGPGVVDAGLGRLFQPLLVNLGISLLPGISLAAHLGGGLAGGALMALIPFGPNARERSWRASAITGVVLMALSVALALHHGRPWEHLD